MKDDVKKTAKAAPKIAMLAIKDLKLASEAPKGTNLVVRDAGRGSPLTDAELKASIYAKGVIYPLMVKRHAGVPYVIAGNRRLKALREIFADAPDSLVQTSDVDDFDGDWREIALDTNLSLPPHLVERYEVIVALSKDLKLSPEDARLRFGMTERQYAQVMRLGSMSALIREKWRVGEIDAKAAQAFTLEKDPKEQDRIYAALRKSSYQGRVDAHSVTVRIVPQNQRDIGRLVDFVGVEAVRAAKILKQEDLFANGHTVTDVPALHKLVKAKLNIKIDEILVLGWAWAIPIDEVQGNTWAFGNVHPDEKLAKPTAQEKKRIAEIEVLEHENDEAEEYDRGLEDILGAEKEAIVETIRARGFTAAQRAKAGCFLKISNDGSLTVEYGRTKPEERKKVEASERKASSSLSGTKKPASKPGDVTLTSALAERLSTQLQKAGAEALKKNPAVAISALIAGFASSGHIIDVRVSSGSPKPGNFADVFAAALKSTPEQRASMLAQVAAQALHIVSRNPFGMPLDRKEDTWALFEELRGSDVVAAITAAFDAKDYFASVSKEAIFQAVLCSMGEDHATKVAKMDKGTAAKFAVEHVTKTGYLPKPLRTIWYTGPEEAKPDAKKAAPTKPPKAAKKVVAKKKIKRSAKES